MVAKEGLLVNSSFLKRIEMQTLEQAIKEEKLSCEVWTALSDEAKVAQKAERLAWNSYREAMQRTSALLASDNAKISPHSTSNSLDRVDTQWGLTLDGKGFHVPF
jgi:hypothetical protein